MVGYRRRIKSLSMFAVAIFVSCFLLNDSVSRINTALEDSEGVALAAAMLKASRENGAILKPLEDAFFEGLEHTWVTPSGSILDALVGHDEGGTYRFAGKVMLPNGEQVSFERVIDEEKTTIIDEFKKDYYGEDTFVMADIHYEVVALDSSEKTGKTYIHLFADARPVYSGYGNVTAERGWYFIENKTSVLKTLSNLKFDTNQIAGEWIGDSLTATEGYLALRRVKDQQKIKLPFVGTELDVRTGILTGSVICAFISILLLHAALGLINEDVFDLSEPWLLLPSIHVKGLTKIIGNITTFVGSLGIVVAFALPAASSVLLWRLAVDSLGNVVSSCSVIISTVSFILSIWLVMTWRFSRKENRSRVHR